MEHGGRFGQHSCSFNGIQDNDCNELISQHALSNGVSHGSVAAFVTYVAPDQMLWFSREDIDGWGISHYPGSDESGFHKSEPRVSQVITGQFPPAQAAWRLDFWGNGWRAFNRPSSDFERELQVNQFCIEHIPGVLAIAVEVHGSASTIANVVNQMILRTKNFYIANRSPMIWQEDSEVSMVAVLIPPEKVLTWLRDSDYFEISIFTERPFEPIEVTGYIGDSRSNLIFSANNCHFRAPN
jgi:hypothetical protein